MANNITELEKYNTTINSTINNIVNNILNCLNINEKTLKNEENRFNEFEYYFRELFLLIEKDKNEKRYYDYLS